MLLGRDKNILHGFAKWMQNIDICPPVTSAQCVQGMYPECTEEINASQLGDMLGVLLWLRTKLQGHLRSSTALNPFDCPPAERRDDISSLIDLN